MGPKDHALLLNLMETGIVTETKYGKTRSAQIKTSVFATSNNIKKISAPLQSRFFVVELEPYTCEQFCDIAEKLLLRQRMEAQVASAVADAVGNKSQDIRDCVKIGTIAKTTTDVEFIVDKFFGPSIRQSEVRT
jgi:Holliday junction DNA helicase RuvB